MLEDDESTRWLLGCYLVAAQFRVTSLISGDQAIQAVKSAAVDLLLLDLGLPGEDGVDVIKTIRQFSRAPVIVVSSNGQPSEIARALDSGADDYICKPAEIGDLVTRVNRCLSRTCSIVPEVAEHWGGPGDVPYATGVLQRIVGPQRTVDVTPVEASILRLLVDAKGSVVSRAEIIANCLGLHVHIESRTIDVHMSRLRRKLKEAGVQGRLGAVRTKGYFLIGRFDLVGTGINRLGARDR